MSLSKDRRLQARGVHAHGRGSCGAEWQRPCWYRHPGSRARELDFIPLFKERYDLAMPRRYWDSRLLTPLRQALASAEYRQAVADMGGYTVERMGQVM